MSVAAEGGPEGDWTNDDPEASLDLLAIRSLRMRSTEDDIGLGSELLFPNEKDLEAFVRDFTIDDAISDCFADLPPSCDDSLRSSNFMPLASQPEKKLVSPRVKADQWKRGSLASSGPPPVSDPPSVASDSASPKSRGFLASLLARGVKGFKTEGRNKKPPVHPHPPAQVQGKAPGQGQSQTSLHNSGVSLAEDGKESVSSDPFASGNRLPQTFAVDGEQECLFEDVSLAYREGVVSGQRSDDLSEHGSCGEGTDIPSSGTHVPNSSVGFGARDTAVGKRSHTRDVSAGKALPTSDDVLPGQRRGAAPDNASRNQLILYGADVSVSDATVRKRQKRDTSAGKRVPVTNHEVRKYASEDSDPKQEASATEQTNNPAAASRNAPSEKNGRRVGDAQLLGARGEFAEQQQQQQQAGATATKTKDPLPVARRGPWEGLIKGIDSFIDFERDPSLEIPLDSHLSSQFDFERDSSGELDSLDSHLASQFEFDVERSQEGGARDPALLLPADSERAPRVSNRAVGAEGDNVRATFSGEEAADTERVYVRLAAAEGLPPSGKACRASTEAFPSHSARAARGNPVNVGSPEESAIQNDAFKCSAMSSGMKSKTSGFGLISSQLVSESTQTEDNPMEAGCKGRAASYIQIAMTQLSNLSSYSPCSEIVGRTMRHLQQALLELSGAEHYSDDSDPAASRQELATSTLAACMGNKTDSSYAQDSRFPAHGSVTKEARSPRAGSSSPTIPRRPLAGALSLNERTASRKSSDGAPALITSADTLPAAQKISEPVGNLAAAHSGETRNAAASAPPRKARGATDEAPVQTRLYGVPPAAATPISVDATTTTTTTAAVASGLRRQREPDAAMTSSPGAEMTSCDTDSVDSSSTSTVTPEPKTTTTKATRQQREAASAPKKNNHKKKTKPSKQKRDIRASPPSPPSSFNGESQSPALQQPQPQPQPQPPPADFVDRALTAPAVDGDDDDDTLTSRPPPTDTAAAVVVVMNSASSSEGRHHRREASSRRSDCSGCSGSSGRRRRRPETAETLSRGSWNRRRREKGRSASSLDTVSCKASTLAGPPPHTGAAADVNGEGEGGGCGADCESFLTSSWSEMTSVSSVCDVITSADESSYYSGDDDDDDEDDEEEEEDDDAAAVVRLGLQDEDRDESELRHHRLQRHLAAVLRQASAPSVAIETVVAATGERLNSQERHPGHVNQGTLYPFSSSGPASAYEAAPTDNKEGVDRAGLGHVSEKAANIRTSRASSTAAKKGGATPRLFSPERQVSQIEARQMTPDQFRETYDRSSDIAKVKRSQLDGDVPWDLLQFSDTDEDVTSEHAWYDVTSEEESAAHAYSTDTDSSAAASDW